ncbi:S-adenosyl-L-methionine-dependent methyltransferase [Podospora appendiculata]|uniref:S-adenosyl-L-methionine-dependent methyltransferase n=1 Tax=Podospora appendiculata TaxID=314037 RepID=A0AAE0X2K6_9PEZI|nr:S-adenosyl-L-methionine-dependent methyltransferase [Podospora appendiculata]
MASTSTSSSLPSASAAPAVARLADAPPEAEAETNANADAEAYERANVHSVYEAIAPHFSATRYKPWPAVAQFLNALPRGSVGLDVGCGNGKYLGVNPGVFMVGSDRSAALVALARDRLKEVPAGTGVKKAVGEDTSDVTNTTAPSSSSSKEGITDVLVADGLSLPFRDGAADFAICIAVIHHMSTRARRQDAIRQLLKCVRAGEAGKETGKVMVMVWALEQGSSRRGWDEGGEQDLLVPWVLKTPQQKQQKQPKQPKQPKQSRKQKKGAQHGQDQEGSDAAVAHANKSGEPPVPSPVPVPEPAAPATDAGGGVSHTDPVFQRYYHLYRKGELEEDVLAAGGLVLESGYEKDNWWTVATNNGPTLSQEQ